MFVYTCGFYRRAVHVSTKIRSRLKNIIIPPVIRSRYGVYQSGGNPMLI